METIYLVAESGRPKELLDAWRKAFFEGMDQYRAIGKELGAKDAMGFPFERPFGFSFLWGEQPEGWTEPQRKGFSKPKIVNTADRERLAAIPFPDHPDAMISRELGLARVVHYDEDGVDNTHRLGSFNTFSFCWSAKGDGTLNDVIVIAPDYQSILKNPKMSNITWGPKGTGPDIPEGFRQVTKAEVELIFAEDNRRREIYKATNTEIALMCDVHTPSNLFRSMQSALSQFGRNLIIDFTCDEGGWMSPRAMRASR